MLNLLSSVVLYNSLGVIDRSAVERLSQVPFTAAMLAFTAAMLAFLDALLVFAVALLAFMEQICLCSQHAMQKATVLT